MHEQHVVSTVVVSRPGVMQQALRTSLSVCSAITILASIGDGLTALKQIESLHPGLVVIDANLLPEESEALVTTIKTSHAPARCLVFVQSLRHEAMMVAAGADAVMLRDSSAGELQAVLARLTEPEP
jgi:DNA-binding NarL/FixJ family response regulator